MRPSTLGDVNLRIRPGLALVWRSPTTLQVGAPEPLAIVENVNTGIDWLIARLRRGATESAAISVAVRHGATRPEARAAVEALRAVLVDVDEGGRPVAQPGARALALRASETDRAALDAVNAALAARAVTPSRLAADELPPPGGVLIEVADFVVPPRRAQPLMSSDVVHLAIVFGDHAIEVTPRIVPGETACLRCADLWRVEADPAWPIVATQLVDARAPRADEAELALTLAIALRVATDPALVVAHRIDRVSGELTTRPWPMHRSCGCRAVPGIETAHGDGREPRPTHSSREAAGARG